jgi:hypothetical protein
MGGNNVRERSQDTAKFCLLRQAENGGPNRWDPGIGIAALGKSGRAVGLPSRVFAPPRQGYLSLLIE